MVASVGYSDIGSTISLVKTEDFGNSSDARIWNIWTYNLLKDKKQCLKCKGTALFAPKHEDQSKFNGGWKGFGETRHLGTPFGCGDQDGLFHVVCSCFHTDFHGKSLTSFNFTRWHAKRSCWYASIMLLLWANLVLTCLKSVFNVY